MYIIGLIDDENSELRKIRRTIKTNSPSDILFDFKSYELTNAEYIYSQILFDIKQKKLDCLIIDYKILDKSFKLQGTEIYNFVNNIVPKFPVVILTERVNESIQDQENSVDADKVYEKKLFFKIEEDYSKQKVTHIFDSIKKYNTQRDALSLELEKQKIKLSNGDREAIPNILKLEKKINSFYPVDHTPWDCIFNTEKMQDAINKLNKANELLEQL